MDLEKLKSSLQRAKVNARLSIAPPTAVEGFIGDQPAVLLELPGGLQWFACRIENMSDGPVVEWWRYEFAADEAEGRVLEQGYLPIGESSPPVISALIERLGVGLVA